MQINVKMLAASVLCGLISCSVFSANFSFYGNTSIGYFTKEDWKVSRAAQLEALNHYKDGVKLSWKNPHTGSYGAFLPLHTVSNSGSVCRNLKILSAANHMSEHATYRFCKFEDQWKVV